MDSRAILCRLNLSEYVVERGNNKHIIIRFYTKVPIKHPFHTTQPVKHSVCASTNDFSERSRDVIFLVFKPH